MPSNLHNEIMNIECDTNHLQNYPELRLHYKQGHRDARHAAAELVLHTSPQKQQKPLSDDEIIAIGYRAGLAIDTLEDEDGDYNTGFLNEEGEIDNEAMLKFASLIEKAHGIGEK